MRGAKFCGRGLSCRHHSTVTQFDIGPFSGKIEIMAIRTSLNVSLTPELEKFVKSRVSTGGYQTASEVVRDGLRLLQRLEREREAAFNTLKRKLKRGAFAGGSGRVC